MNREPQQCMDCGALIHSTKIPMRLKVKGVRHVAPGDCSEDERVPYCPKCGEEETFEPRPTNQEFLPFVKKRLVANFGELVGNAAWEVALRIRDRNVRPTPRNIARIMDEVNDGLAEEYQVPA